VHQNRLVVFRDQGRQAIVDQPGQPIRQSDP
jgi:hypothetical protein